MNRLVTLIISSLCFWLLGVAFAQTSAPVIAGVTVPDSVWYIAATIIGFIVKGLASPLAQLLKTHWGWQGNAARLLYAVLSLLFVVGFGLLTGAFGSGAHGWLSALEALAIAIYKGYGEYSTLVDTSAVGAGAALPSITVNSVPPVIHPVGTAGMEPLHNINGDVVGSTPPLTPGQPVEVKTGLENLK